MGMTWRDERGRPLGALLRYDPVNDPLVIMVRFRSSFLSGDVIILRELLVRAFAEAPHPCGGGPVALQVIDPYTMRVMVDPGGGRPMSLLASTQAVMSFGQATLNMVPVCMQGACEEPACQECAWVRRVIPGCSCGSVGCPGPWG